MKKLILTFIIIINIFLFYGCGDKKASSNWISNKIEIDGVMEDWNDIPATFIEKHNMQIKLCNDSGNLYVMFGFRDQFLARMLQRTGVRIWLDGKAKKKKEFGIHYQSIIPLMDRPPSPPGAPPEEKPDDTIKRREIMGNLNIISKDGQEFSLPLSSFGPSCALDVEDGLYRFELMIPLQKTDNTPYAIEALPGDKMNIGLEIGTLSAKDREKMREERGDRDGRGGGSDGGMSGRRGGGLGGRPGGMGGRQMPETLDMWLTVSLAEEMN